MRVIFIACIYVEFICSIRWKYCVLYSLNVFPSIQFLANI